jgi:hypothetical protein
LITKGVSAQGDAPFLLAALNTIGGIMANKTTNTRTEERFDFTIDHADVVSMMNDTEVLIDDGNVTDDQAFQIVFKKANGTEVILKEMTATDTLVFRFTKVTVVDDSTDLGGIDIQTP